MKEQTIYTFSDEELRLLKQAILTEQQMWETRYFINQVCSFYGDYDPGISRITGKCGGFIPHSEYDYNVAMKEYCMGCPVRGFDISSANPDPRRHKGDS